jgi:hypothetical protein
MSDARAQFDKEMKRLQLMDAVAAKTIQRSVDQMLRDAAVKGPPQQALAFEAVDDQDTNAKQATKILKALRKAGAKGVTNLDLNKICLRYGARIHTLRHADGHKISTTQEKGRVFRFTLITDAVSLGRQAVS